MDKGVRKTPSWPVTMPHWYRVDDRDDKLKGLKAELKGSPGRYQGATGGAGQDRPGFEPEK